MEMSHRTKEFNAMWHGLRKDIRDYFDVPENYEIFIQMGGAHQQFAAVPLNLLKGKAKANYLVTG